MKKLYKLRGLLMIIVSLLVLLWIYTAFSKLSDLRDFKQQLYNQSFNPDFAGMLLWLIPGIEITATLLLCFIRTRLSGLLLSTVLMLLFTGYIGLVLTGHYDRIPCSCGGVLKDLGWKAHLLFNIFFLVIALSGTYIQLKLLKYGKEDALR